MHRTNPLSTFAGAPSGARPGTLPHSPGASSGVRRESSCARRALRLHGGHPPELVRHPPARRTPSCPRQAPSDARRTPSGARLARSSTSLYSGVLLRAVNEGPRTTPWSTRRVRRGQRRSNRRAPQPTETRTGARPSQRTRHSQRRSNRGARASGWDGSADFVDPAVWVRTAAVLDPEKFVTKAHGHRSRLTVADNPIPVGGLHPAHRRYHRGRAAGKSLG